MMKARLRKVEDLTRSKIKQNISNVIRNIPKKNMKIYLRVLIIEIQYM